MVKQIFSFLRWQINKFTWVDYTWFLGAGMIGAGWESKGVVFYLGLLVVWTIVVGGLVKMQWLRWKDERKELLDTIKNSK